MTDRLEDELAERKRIANNLLTPLGRQYDITREAQLVAQSAAHAIYLRDERIRTLERMLKPLTRAARKVEYAEVERRLKVMLEQMAQASAETHDVLHRTVQNVGGVLVVRTPEADYAVLDRAEMQKQTARKEFLDFVRALLDLQGDS